MVFLKLQVPIRVFDTRLGHTFVSHKVAFMSVVETQILEVKFQED